MFPILLANQAETGAFVLFFATAAALTISDLRDYRLPDRLLLPGMAGVAMLLGVASGIGGSFMAFHRAVLLAGLSVALHLLLHLLHRTGLGFGDVKLAGLTGLLTGWVGYSAWLLGLVGSFAAAGGVALLLLATRGIGRTDPIAFGPWMLLAATAAIVNAW